jgi:RNA polymerase subunit RPABC4/transcription elongation factor Spt4
MALIQPDEVRRLFEGLVTELAERDPIRLRNGFVVADLYQRLIPYRTHRNKLGFLTNQDYEGAVLGLLAGLGGYATMEPVEAQETLAEEAASPNPDTTLFREFAGARVRLNLARVDRLLASESGEAAYAPPEPQAPPPTIPPPPTAPAPHPPVFELAPAPAPEPVATGRCAACDSVLPADRPVVFCPYCGRPVGASACARCGDELRADWSFCPRCGQARTA